MTLTPATYMVCVDDGKCDDEDDDELTLQRKLLNRK